MQRIGIALLFGLLLSISSDSYSFPNRSSDEFQASLRLRRPVAIVTSGNRILVGNRQSGTISVIEPTGPKVVAEYPVAARIADLKRVPDGGGLLVLDDQKNELVRVSLGASRHVVATVPTSAVKLAVSARRHRIFISSKWSRQLTAIDVNDEYKLASQTQTVSLPFASHEMLLLEHNRSLLVAEAFGGRIAVFDAETLKLRGIRKLSGHNIRGLEVSRDGKQLYVSHQTLNPSKLADYEDVHWGRLVSNAVQVFGVRSFLDDDFAGDDPATETEGWLDEFGRIGGASADPGAVIAGREDMMAVCLSGTSEVAIRAGGSVRRIPVGLRPAALAIHSGRLYVANQFDDSISVVQIDNGNVLQSVTLGPKPKLSATERGELLFFDAKLSHDGWMSCHSCHTDGHTAGLLVDTLGDGDYGSPKRIPSLLGTGKTGPWGWNGSKKSLADQVQTSVTTTMHGEPLRDEQVSDLASYLISLPAPPPAVQQTAGQVRRGRELFTLRGCVTCHVPPYFTTPETYDVGLADEKGRRNFNPPSLRGVSQRGRLLHDGRAASLEDLLLTIRHQLDRPLNEEEAKALLAYLRSL